MEPRFRTPGLRFAGALPGVSLRCPRTAVNNQWSPPAATREREGGVRSEPASNVAERAHNAQLARWASVPSACPNRAEPRDVEL